MGLRHELAADLCTINPSSSWREAYANAVIKLQLESQVVKTLAALFLRKMNFNGSQVVYDMCGSGTIVIEAAEIALVAPAGRQRILLLWSYPHLKKMNIKS